jgi:lactate permease
MWQQNYEPVGGSLGLSAIVAAIPIIVLFVILGVMRKPAWMAALSALGAAMVDDLRRSLRNFSDRVDCVQLDSAVSVGGQHRQV